MNLRDEIRELKARMARLERLATRAGVEVTDDDLSDARSDDTDLGDDAERITRFREARADAWSPYDDHRWTLSPAGHDDQGLQGQEGRAR